MAPDNPLPGWHSPDQAWAQTQGQLAWYRAMEEAGEIVQIVDVRGLDAQLSRWTATGRSKDTSIGYVLSLEGADSILTPAHVERAYAQGLRAIGPAHYGPGRYAMGTDATGGLRPGGRELLAEMERLNIILDATHLATRASSRRWTTSAAGSGPATTTAGRSCRTTGSSRTNKSGV